MGCVFCNVTENLNTVLTITVDDGSRVQVQICDTHAEDATVKTAKAAYQSKQVEIQKVIEQARALGLSIGQSASGLVIAQGSAPAAQPSPTAKPTLKPQSMHIQRAEGDITTDFDENDPSVVSTSQLNTRNTTSRSGMAGGTALESHSMLTPGADKLSPELLEGKAKLAVVEGRTGQPIIIPRKRVDKTGTTVVNIKKTEDDHKLQQRFKQMSQQSMLDGGEPNFARAGYGNTTRTCPICHGDCLVNGEDCPKCQGSGIISVF